MTKPPEQRIRSQIDERPLRSKKRTVQAKVNFAQTLANANHAPRIYLNPIMVQDDAGNVEVSDEHELIIELNIPVTFY